MNDTGRLKVTLNKRCWRIQNKDLKQLRPRRQQQRQKTIDFMIKTTAPVADPGDPSPPPLFIDQTEARGAEIKFFGRPPLPPFSKGLDDRPPLSQGGLDPAVHVSRFLASCFSTFLLRPLHD